MKLNLTGRRIPLGPNITPRMYEIGIVGFIIAAILIGWWIAGASWRASERIHAQRMATTRPRTISMTVNAELAARQGVWAWAGHAAWAREVSVTCRATEGMAQCRVTSPGRRPIEIVCDNSPYPFNDGCVWTGLEGPEWDAP